MNANYYFAKATPSRCSRRSGWLRVRTAFSGLLAMVFPLLAWADGNVVRFRQANDTWALTFLAPPWISSGAATELHFVLQQLPSGKLSRDAEVNLAFAPPAGVTLPPEDPLCTPADGKLRPGAGLVRTRAPVGVGQVAYTATVRFATAGTWQVHAVIRSSGAATEFSVPVSVGAAGSVVASIWPGLTLPPIAIALFATNQWLRRDRRARTPLR